MANEEKVTQEIEFDSFIFKPMISQVVKGLQGKVFIFYGDNGTGKSYQAARFPKPYFLACEPGLEAIPGIPFLYFNEWSKLEKFKKHLVTNIDEFKKHYETLVVDPLDAFGSIAIKQVNETFDHEYLGQKKQGDSKYSPEYKYLESLVQEWIRGITILGLTVVFLDHEDFEKVKIDGEEYKYAVPSGDNRVVKAVCDLATIGYAKSNGVDEQGNPIYSTLYLKENPKGWKARSRYIHMPYSITFTKENLENAMIEAIEKDEKTKQVGTIDIDTYNQKMLTNTEPIEEIKKKIVVFRKQIQQVDKDAKGYFAIIENRLGNPDAKLKPLGEEKRSTLELILMDLEEYITKNQIPINENSVEE